MVKLGQTIYMPTGIENHMYPEIKRYLSYYRLKVQIIAPALATLSAICGHKELKIMCKETFKTPSLIATSSLKIHLKITWSQNERIQCQNKRIQLWPKTFLFLMSDEYY